MNRKALEFWVGLFVAAGMAALAMLAFKVGNLGTADVNEAYKITARFENVGGLKIKSPVTMAGVRIGRVSAIEFDAERYRAVVTMSIDGRYDKLPTDSSASILTSGLLGEQYVGLDAGGAIDFLQEGSVVELTQSALVLEKMIGRFLFSLSSGEKK